MNIHRIIPLIGILLAGCAGGQVRDAKTPDWVDGSSDRYPSNAYLIGIGSADSLAVARDRARADLAKIFRVNVQETSRDEQRYHQENAESDYSSEVQRELTTRTDQVLEGVRVPESWQDPETRRHHALAVLDRMQAASGLREDINALDAASEVLLNRARVAEDAFTRARLALEVVDMQRRRAALQDMLRAVDTSGRGVSPRWSLQRLEADLQTALSRISLQPLGEEPWKTMLAGQLADSGFRVAEDGEYEVRLDVRRDVTRRDGWYWARGNAVLGVQAADGRSLGQQRWEIKESATDRQTARMRFEEAVAGKLGHEGRAAILDIVRD